MSTLTTGHGTGEIVEGRGGSPHTRDLLPFLLNPEVEFLPVLFLLYFHFYTTRGSSNTTTDCNVNRSRVRRVCVVDVFGRM